jgi:predicted nucleotidyltransferase component of viral defense system
MTHPAILNMLERYDLTNADSSYDALREILQEIVLLALYEAGFFKHAAFYGGTALRILHQLPRFSEDLDFSLLKPNLQFDISPFQQAIRETLLAYGFDVRIEIKKNNPNSAIASAFIKGNTLEHLINIQAPPAITQVIHKEQLVKIKLEVDTDPPLLFTTEEILRLTPRAYSVKAFTLPSLFSGKLHAVLCRAWGNRLKGRDWYDLVWHISKSTKPDLTHLQARLKQSCKFLESKNIVFPEYLTLDVVINLLEQRIACLDITKAKADVLPFIRDSRELDLWSAQFFMQVIQQIK